MKEKLLISACLMGENCKYSGGNNLIELPAGFLEQYELIPVCPEILGGLPTPRTPAERLGDRVLTQTGADVTENYRLGSEIALAAAREQGCQKALLKERSPSCGSGAIYDGTFSHTVISGDGVAAALLKANGIEVFGESRITELLK